MADTSQGDTVSALDTLRKQVIDRGANYMTDSAIADAKTREGQLARLQVLGGKTATQLAAVQGQIKDALGDPESDDDTLHDLHAKAASLQATLGYLQKTGQEIAGPYKWNNPPNPYQDAPVDAKAAAALRQANPAPSQDPHYHRSSIMDNITRGAAAGVVPSVLASAHPLSPIASATLGAYASGGPGNTNK